MVKTLLSFRVEYRPYDDTMTVLMRDGLGRFRPIMNERGRVADFGDWRHAASAEAVYRRLDRIEEVFSNWFK